MNVEIEYRNEPELSEDCEMFGRHIFKAEQRRIASNIRNILTELESQIDRDCATIKWVVDGTHGNYSITANKELKESIENLLRNNNFLKDTVPATLNDDPGIKEGDLVILKANGKVLKVNQVKRNPDTLNILSIECLDSSQHDPAVKILTHSSSDLVKCEQ